MLLDHFLKLNNNQVFIVDEHHQFTYAQFFQDLETCLNHPLFLNATKRCLLKTSHPYYFLLSFLSLSLLKKSPTVISQHLPEFSISKIKVDCYFEEIIDPNLISFNFLSDIKLKKTNSLISIFDKNGPFDFQLLTSGTTSIFKIYTFDFESILNHVSIFQNFFNTSSPKTLLNLPLHHVSGFMSLFRAFFSNGNIFYQVSPEYFQEKNIDIDFISLVPSQLYSFLQDEKRVSFLKNCKFVLIGGAHLAEDQIKLLKHHSIHYFETYGMTETLSFVAINDKLLPSIKVVNNDNFYINSKTMAKYLWISNRPTKCHLEIFGGIPYIKTNDQVLFLPPNFLQFKSRKDKIINSGGVKISLNYLNDFSKKTVEIKEFYLSVIKHPKWGEVTAIFFELSDKNFNIEEYFKNNLPPYHSPKFFIPFNFSLEKSIKRDYLTFYRYFLDYLFPSDSFVPNQSSKKILFTLHGFLESSQDYSYLKNDFDQLNQIHIDLAGSSFSSHYNFKNLDEFLFYLSESIKVKSEGFEKIYILGYSQGGRIAINLLKYNLRFDKLILISTSYGLKTKEDINDRLYSDNNLLKNVKSIDDLKSFFKNWYQQDLFQLYNQSSDYQNKLNNLNIFDIEKLKNGINLLSQGRFPLEDEQINFLINHAKKIHYIVGCSDIKYFNLGVKLKGQINNINTYFIENTGHKLIKTHFQEVKKILITIFE